MFEVVPEQLAWLATRLVDAAETLHDGRGALAPVDRGVCGDTTVGLSFAGAVQNTMDSAATAASQLLDVLRSDVDKLRDVAANYAAADAGGRGHMEAIDSIDVYSTHVSGARPDQIAGVWDVVGGSGDRPTVLAGDFNTDIDGNQSGREGEIFDSAARRELERFDDLGFTDAGQDAGPTSGDPERIDYIFTKGVSPVDTEVIDGGPSDHDGLVTELVIPDDNPWDDRG